MFKLLVNSPGGEQIIVDIKSTGQYFDSSRVIWDERTDGAMPEVTLGKMQRSNDQLVTLQDYLPAHLAATLSSAKTQKTNDLNAAYQSVLYADIQYNDKTYAATADRQELLSQVLAPGSVPAGMFWTDVTGAEISMTFADLQGLGLAMLTRGVTAKSNLNTKLAAVQAATTQAEVDAITW